MRTLHFHAKKLAKAAWLREMCIKPPNLL